MFKKFSIIGFFFSTSLWATEFRVFDKDSAWANPNFPKSFITEENLSCKDRIETLLCLAEPVESGKEKEPRECIDEDLDFAVIELEKLHDAYPKELQKVFCSLDVIYIERDFFGTAYAGIVGEEQTVIMGIRETALRPDSDDKPLSMSQWISWKEQLSFGGDSDSYTVSDDLVKVEVSMNSRESSDFLYFVIAHEFGHILDFANKANDFDCEKGKKWCKPKANTWSAFSWERWDTQYPWPNPEHDPWGLFRYIPKPQSRFAHRDQLCFYACKENHGSPELMSELYESLDGTDLLTTYSATQPYDDFAEALAFYSGVMHANMSYVVKLPSGEKYDLSEKFKSEIYSEKYEWLDRFINSDELLYP